MALGQRFADVRPIAGAVATLGVNERVAFIRKTYAHLAGAIGLFMLLEYMFLQSELAMSWTLWALGGRWTWLLVLGLFMIVGKIAENWAQSATSRPIQYVGLGLYVVAEVILFAPILLLALFLTDDPYIIHKAGLLTLTIFAGLTGTVLLTRKDFSFLRGALGVGGMAAMGLIVASMIFGFSLGVLFSAFMIALAAGYILYYTSQVFAHYRPTQYVAASLALFAAIALLFWYVLRLLMSLRN